MADIKWIKLDTGIFEDEKIKIILKMPDGKSMLVIWLKLLCLAGRINNSGVLMVNKTIPYTSEMLSAVFDEPENMMRLALDTFEKLDMVEQFNGTLLLPNWEKHQNIDGLEKIRNQTKERVERYRENQRLLMGIQVCQYCGGKATGVDHVVAIARGGTDEADNLVPCCIECNRMKNDKPLVDFLNNNINRICKKTVADNAILSKLATFNPATTRFDVALCNADVTQQNKELRTQNKEQDVSTPPNGVDAPFDAFGMFWLSYPKKIAKESARKAWKKINLDLFDTIMNALEQHKKSAQWLKDDGQYVPNASTWLNQKRWEDEIINGRKPGGKKVSFQSYDQGEEQIYTGPDLLKEAREARG